MDYVYIDLQNQKNADMKKPPASRRFFLYGRCNLAVKGESFGYALLIQGMNASVAQKPAQIAAHVAYVIVMAIVNVEYASMP